ncbi:FtsX-like permease family protein [Corynebacterium sp. 239_CJEI]|uniref:FtsX-like permease family protein n=1 Tax=Corynebacterium sp. 239_CJEI TaxID=2715674 RepID=UPI000665B958|nr:FtsX-like permease family protein [Corynebacterium sp. 239_CJEI]
MSTVAEATKPQRIPTGALADLSTRLQRAGRESHSGNGWLSALSVVAMTVSTWLALVVVGGTGMFYRRWQAEPKLPPNPTPEDYMNQGQGEMYLQLALVACVFVIPAMVSLVAQSAVLGAAGREQRLATLRLIGLSNGAVTRMVIIETLVLAAVGLVVGTLLSVATAPFWAIIKFDNDYLDTWDMLLPWWGYPLVWVAVVLLALFAAVVGLRRVMISPLGVSRKEVPKSMKAWRMIVAVVIGAIVLYVIANSNIAGGTVTATLGVAAMMYLMVWAIGLVAPFFIQLVARISSFFGTSSDFVATRRVATNAKESWRRVSSMAFLSLLLGYTMMVPGEDKIEEVADVTFAHDIATGVTITFVIGFILLLVSTLLTQASAVYEEASLTKALDFIGTPISFHRTVTFKQTFFPMLATSIFGFVMGALLGATMFGPIANEITFGQRSLVVALAYLVGVVSVGAVTLAVDPLRHKLLGRQIRHND